MNICNLIFFFFVLCVCVEQILPEKCRYVVLSTKVEIRLVKAECINWPSLEYSKEIAVTQKVNVSSGKLHAFIMCTSYIVVLLFIEILSLLYSYFGCRLVIEYWYRTPIDDF
jgi:hypothetical protein